MSIFCMFGFHSWRGCKCQRCGKTRDAEHRWRKCKCEMCGKVRDTEHEWSGCKCAVCGKTRDRDHNWGDAKCQTCGAQLSTDEMAKRWAEKLQSTTDYHALAAYLCSYHSHVDDPLGYNRSVDLWNAKNRYAREILLTAGAEAVDTMLAEMEKGKDKDYDVAKILVRIGDPRAVPLLKRLDDRDQWGAYGVHSEITDFVNKFPQYHGEVEKLPCPICGKVRPVTETKQCGDKRFCEGSCWSKRGRVVEHGIGTDCPFYAEGVCMAGGRDTGLCSLQSGPYESSCHVYAMHKGTVGLRTCAACGAQWRSTYGAMKDMSMFGPQAQVSATYDPANLLGLSCTECGRSFCKNCLSGRIPCTLPGGSCPQCGGKLNLA